jgi:hypothetical protein
MPDLPRVQLPHPVAGRDPAALSMIAGSIVDAILSALRGPDSPHPRS